MAKKKMICPFSKKLCRDCAIYRGRHYYLCFCEKYRGYIAESTEISKANGGKLEFTVNNRLEISPALTTCAVEPFE